MPNAKSVIQKYTLQSQGIWERIRKAFAVAPNRSNGVPLNPQYRNPPPGEPSVSRNYHDPVSIPAGDIADNQYYNRDVRRAHARLSVVNQGDVVGLLTVGSKAAPKEETLGIGETGEKKLVAVKEEGEKGLAAYFQQQKGGPSAVLGTDGMPPMPVGMGRASGNSTKRYTLEEEQTYGNENE